MQPTNPILFYTTESRFGCSQPVRSGDLLVIKGFDLGLKYSGSHFLVIEARDVYDLLMIRGVVNGKILDINTESLEWPNENR